MRLNSRKQEPLEADIQARLIKGLEKRGWYVQKTEGRSRNGFPDVTVVDMWGNTWFIELKRTVGRPSEDQRRELAQLAAHNANIMLVYGLKGVDWLLSVKDWREMTNRRCELLIINSEGEPKWVKRI